APVAVDTPRRFAAVAMTKGDAPLEDVGVVARVVARRIGRGHTEQGTKIGDEKLVVGKLGTIGMLPAGEEICGGKGGAHGGGLCHEVCRRPAVGGPGRIRLAPTTG